MTVEGYARAVVVSMAVLGTTGFALPANAAATPTVAFTTRAVPVPGAPGTGDRLGDGAAIQAEGTISGTEYGGAPPPVLGVRYFAPAGMRLHPQGFATCAPSVLQAQGPNGCPKRSISGSNGSAQGVVSFGGERVPETVSLREFFAPGGGMIVFIDGVTPVSVEIIANAHVTTAPPPYGLEFSGEIPLIETVPGALDASAVQATVELGAAYRQGGTTVSYVTLPTTCPRGGWREKVQVSFLGGASAESSARMPCPRR